MQLFIKTVTVGFILFLIGCGGGGGEESSSQANPSEVVPSYEDTNDNYYDDYDVEIYGLVTAISGHTLEVKVLLGLNTLILVYQTPPLT